MAPKLAARLASRPSERPTPTPARPHHAIDDYDLDDVDDPFADSGDDATANKTANANSQSRKRKDASGLGIDEAVSVAKKPRVPRVKLDESRLLSDNGIPKLRAKAKNLHFKGKGHEVWTPPGLAGSLALQLHCTYIRVAHLVHLTHHAQFSDAARLLSFYQLWLDDLFPKAKFLDALSMVEKAGHKNQLRLKRMEWINEGQPKDANADEDGDDLFGDSHQPEERDTATSSAQLSAAPQSGVAGQRATTPADYDPFDDDIYGASPRRPTNTAPTKFPAPGDGASAQANGEPDEDELDALMAEEEAQRNEPVSSIFGSGNTAQTWPTHDVPGEDDDLDALMAEAEAQASTRKPTEPRNHKARATVVPDDEEDDLDALMAEAEAEVTETKPPPNKPTTKPEGGSIDEDEEAAMAEMDGLW
ncbi:replication fork protection component Swi3-domain-containing protein [Nemania sp. FL0916]|nr:replication fork protection component Swi3-domain-containing protein [Nemania sp. FL0916]